MKTEHMTIEKWFYLLVVGLVIYLFWLVVKPFALVLLTATVAAIVLTPLDRFLVKHLKHRKLSAAIIAVGSIILIFVPLLSILLLMARQASELIQTSIGNPNWLNELQIAFAPIVNILPETLQAQVLNADVQKIAAAIASWVFNNIGEIFSSTTKLLLNTFIFFIALYYLIVDRAKIYNEALILSPLRDSVDKQLLTRVVSTVRSVVFGVLILAVIQGIMAGIGMTIFGVPGSLLWGAVTIVAAMVPFVGTALILIPAIFYLFITGSAGAGAGLLIWSVIFVGLADNVLGPYLIKGTTHMHAFLVLISVLGGLHAFGSIGGLAGPVILAALLATIEIYKSGILTTGKMKGHKEPRG